MNIKQEREISSFVSREVIYCVSSLVSTLASIASEFGKVSDGNSYDDIMEICVQDDWESPARENGWEKDQQGQIYKPHKKNETTVDCEFADDWREACEQDNLDPYTVEAYEHWIVSNWLAAKLEAKGEMIGRDICGLTIWGRTTTGQAISMDGVIQEIYKELQGE